MITPPFIVPKNGSSKLSSNDNSNKNTTKEGRKILCETKKKKDAGGVYFGALGGVLNVHWPDAPVCGPVLQHVHHRRIEGIIIPLAGRCPARPESDNNGTEGFRRKRRGWEDCWGEIRGKKACPVVVNQRG